MKLFTFMVRVSIGSLNCNVNAELTGTSVWPLNTLVLSTVGEVRSGPAPVLNVTANGVKSLPAPSCSPLMATVTTALGGNVVSGVIVTSRFPLANTMLAGNTV